MSKIHGNAALTVRQRKLIRRLYLDGTSISDLARRFNVNWKTAERWAKREQAEDLRSGPKKPRKLVSPEYIEAVLTHRQSNPDHGAITIAYHLKKEFPFAHRGTVQKILTQRGMSKPTIKESRTPKN